MSDVGIPESTAYALLAMTIVLFAGTFVVAFLIGSIPFGYIIGRLFYHTDIRTQGSGNIGAMNALRTLGKGGAIAVLLLDALKGFLPTYFWLYFIPANHLDFDFIPNLHGDQLIASLAATGAILGHCFSPWLRFRGGKGVATSFGALFALCWPVGLISVAWWVVGALLTRYSSIGSMLGSIMAPFSLVLFRQSIWEIGYAIFAAILIIFKHRDNIARLRAGTEGSINLSRRDRRDPT